MTKSLRHLTYKYMHVMYVLYMYTIHLILQLQIGISDLSNKPVLYKKEIGAMGG